MALAAIDLAPGAKVHMFYDGKVFAKIGQGHDIDETDFFIV